jgi:hypothetical protein
VPLGSGTARAVSDGSFKDKFGTAAFTVVDDMDTSIIGLNVVPGHPDDQGAYRSELAGLFGIVLVFNLPCRWAGISSGAIEVGCDGLSALTKAFDTWPLEPDDPHFDMLSAVRTMIADSPVSLGQHATLTDTKITTLPRLLTCGLCIIYRWIISPKFSG